MTPHPFWSLNRVINRNIGRDAGGGRENGRVSPLIEGKRLRTLYEANRPRFVDMINRLIAKQRDIPSVRIDEYINAQRSPYVKESVRRMMKNREWRYISFREFLETLTRVTQRMFEYLDHARNRGKRVCFVIDDLHKSSFWVLGMSLHILLERVSVEYASAEARKRKTNEIFDRFAIAVDSDGAFGGMMEAFKKLPNETILVLMDDATYSGEQLTYIYNLEVSNWIASAKAHANPKPHVVVCVPFMAEPSLRLFGGAKLFHEVKFTSLFHRRRVGDVLSMDLYLESSSRTAAYTTFSEYQSFFFDFLGIMPPNTLLFFEHKIADGLSIPNRWLHFGPCVGSEFKHAYRVKPSRIQDLVKFLRKDMRKEQQQQGDYSQLAGMVHKDMARRVSTLLHSPVFRKYFMERVSLDPPHLPTTPKHFPRFVPLLPPEHCGPRYRRALERKLHGQYGSFYGLPDCRKPPYKRQSFRGRIMLQP